jgi:transcription antitermination factor NusG
MQLDIAANHAPPSLPPDARGPPFGPECASYPRLSETHSGSEPWIAAGISRATWYRRSRNIVVPFRMPIGVFRWYVVRTVHNQTDVADCEIWAAGFEVFSPQIFKPAVPAHRSATGTYIRAREERFDPLFVRYIIVSLDLTDPSWREIPNMDSVERIISGGYLSNNGIGIPIAVPNAAIEGLRKELAPDGCLYPRGYRVAPNGRFYPEAHFHVRGEPIEVGTSLRMPDGPEGNNAGISEMSDGARIVMLMNWFNRDNVRTHVAQSAVEIVAG